MEFSAGYWVVLFVGFIAVVVPSAVVAIRFWSASRASRVCVLIGMLVVLVQGVLMVFAESDSSPSDIPPFSFEVGSLVFLLFWGVWFYMAMFVYGVVQGGKALMRRKLD
ncbi:MAG: hypothetical protein K2Y13_16380 [Burkholderiaceae bacterium]|uniref:hypothetical protein n=1 Tax=Herminiimonas sp. Marseille-P9896 TaxID=2742211 RepID=UPI00158E0284|nr:MULTISPECIES: hypothetical protein [Oxalobacteraceae]MBX9801034.1 hypothetical protein [Burkholderiaceae bacterium]